MPSVYIILLNWNGWRDTLECLNSLRQLTYLNLHIVVLDNASIDNSIEEIKKWMQENDISYSEYTLENRKAFPKKITSQQSHRNLSTTVSLLMSSVNLGFCAGNNVGMEFASHENADYFLVLNNDTICEQSFLEPLVQVAMANNNVGLISGSIRYADRPSVLWWGGGRLDIFLRPKRVINKLFDKNCYATEWVTGCMMLMPKKILENLGGFDEDFFVWHEDVDLSLRVKKNGYKLLFVPKSVIFHKVSRTIGHLSPMAYYYSARNTLLLSKKHLGKIKQVIFLFYFLVFWIIRLCFFIVRGRFDIAQSGIMGIRDYFLGFNGEMKKESLEVCFFD